ncbi:WD40 repeat containing protein [Pseudohyphozyma bogoriensis]|nr:WD40 repeat containing protein [Pseudohyphozyma bogoriensis]
MAPERSTASPLTQSHLLIARFLRSQGYNDTLAAFKREAAAVFLSDPLDLDADANKAPDLREVVEDYLTSRMASLELPPLPLEEELEKLEVTVKIPTKVVQTIRDSTNVLTVQSGVLPQRHWDTSTSQFKCEFTPSIFTTSVDRTLKIYSSPSYSLLATHQFPSPVLSVSICPTHPRFLVAATMEGSLSLVDLVTREVVQKVKDHSKYIVRSVWSADGSDRLLQVYQVHYAPTEEPHVALDDEEPDELANPPKVSLILRHTVTAKSNPEAAAFLPSSSHLVYSARDDNVLRYLKLPSASGEDGKDDWTTTGINLNENGDAWVSFSVLYITIHPTLPLLSLQTSTENSRILLYPFHSSTRLTTLFTTASQSEFTTPRHQWLQDGTAVVVNSEDGVLRVVDLKGKVRARIGAHGIAAPLEEEDDGSGTSEERSERVRLRREAERGSSVVKDVEVLVQGGELRLLSCGFDKTVKIIGVE